MILASKEKTMRMHTLTEKETPFRDTKTQRIFKNTANLSLRGTTYDARHLDSFLASNYAEKASTTNGHNKSAFPNKS